MEVRDGFIVGIFNYCDRWCETCAFTSRCRLFADQAECEARTDPLMKEIVDAPPLPQDIPPPPPRWMEELIQEMNSAAADALEDEDVSTYQPKMAAEHEPIQARAHAYGGHTGAWLQAYGGHHARDPKDPLAVIGWFRHLISSKIFRALTGLHDDDPRERDWPADHDGSAKVALLGIERSHAAWLQLVAEGRATAVSAEPFIADLVWLGEQLERTFPHARAFVRPGFD